MASLHAAFDRNPTERSHREWMSPHVDCLGHLTARKIKHQAPADVDVEASSPGARDGTFLETTRSRTGSTFRDTTRARGRGGGLKVAGQHRRA